jgi:hypothetical protein
MNTPPDPDLGNVPSVTRSVTIPGKRPYLELSSGQNLQKVVKQQLLASISAGGSRENQGQLARFSSFRIFLCGEVVFDTPARSRF